MYGCIITLIITVGLYFIVPRVTITLKTNKTITVINPVEPKLTASPEDIKKLEDVLAQQQESDPARYVLKQLHEYMVGGQDEQSK